MTDEPCAELSWDSKFWGFPVARVNGETLDGDTLPTIVRWCADHATRCLYFRCPTSDERSAQMALENGFVLVDTRVTMETDAVNDVPGSDVRAAEPNDIELLAPQARGAYTDTRFFFDAHFPRERCADLYETWLRESMKGFADVVLVIDRDGAPRGYVTVSLSNADAIARIGLLAVERAFAGRALGRTLIAAAISWAAGHGAHRLVVVTQARNAGAVRTYEAAGFRTTNTALQFHRWFEAAKPQR
jgi:dTDP-4-amino-4,6-dideoxy-D-galactose acyltransferase